MPFDDLVKEAGTNRLNELVVETAREIADICVEMELEESASYELKCRLVEAVNAELRKKALYGIIDVASNGVLVRDEQGTRLVALEEFLTREQKRELTENPGCRRALLLQIRKDLQAKIAQA
jgi:hypothetical protein